MIRLRSSTAIRLLLWLLLATTVSLGAFAFFIRAQIRDQALQDQAELLRARAQEYSARLQARPGEETAVSLEMMEAHRGELFYLISSNGNYLAYPDPAKIGQSSFSEINFATLQRILAETSTIVLDAKKDRLLGTYRENLNAPVAIAQASLAEKSATVDALLRRVFWQILGVLLLINLAAWISVSYLVTTPINRIGKATAEIGTESAHFAESASPMMSGDIKKIYASLQEIARRLQSSSAQNENINEERLAAFERRSMLLKAVADVGKAITSFRNLSELLEQTAHLINENFGYYHAGIFLLDEHKEYAVLQAANSAGGKRMLARKHQLKVGSASIVGYVTQNIRARIALDVGADAVYFDNPDLRQTRSEMALPLVVGGQILGALDVQSVEPSAFTEEDVATLQILAEQLAVAIQNANLLSETEKALETARMVYGEMSREAWSKILRSQPRVSFLATPPGTVEIPPEAVNAIVHKAFETGDLLLGADNLTISVPIKIRGQSIGAIRLKKPEIAEAWTQDEINLAIALSDQLSGALESARLYKESQQRAARESLVADIGARISAISHTDAILRETVQELGQAVGKVSVTFQLLDEFSPPNLPEIAEVELPARRKDE